MEIRAIAPNEWNYTYSQSMQITGQTGNIGHLRGDFDSGGYGFYTTWSDHRPQWKTDEFKTELDEVINTLRSKESVVHFCNGAVVLKSLSIMLSAIFPTSPL